MATGWEFTKIFNFDGSSTYTDVTLEAQSPAGTPFTVLNTAAHYLYLGNAEKFDMAVFDEPSIRSKKLVGFCEHLVYHGLVLMLTSVYYLDKKELVC